MADEILAWANAVYPVCLFGSGICRVGQKCAGAPNNPQRSEMVVKSEVSQGALICWPKLKPLPTTFRP